MNCVRDKNIDIQIYNLKISWMDTYVSEMQ
jgi:hypothetical protein